MKNSFGLLFYLKKSKINSRGECPIYLRITVNGKRTEISISRKIEENKWNSTANRAIGRSEKSKALNYYLDVITSKIYRYHREFIEGEIEITTLKLKVCTESLQLVVIYLFLALTTQSILLTHYRHHAKAWRERGYSFKSIVFGKQLFVFCS